MSLSRDFETDKRRYIRYEILDYALLHSPDQLEPINAVIVDIGLGGLQVRSRSNLPMGTIVKLHVGRLDRPPLILRGEVRHSVPIPESDLVATGVRFLPENHDDRMTVAEYVHGIFQRQCDLLAN